jgi:amino acid transporter
MLSEAKHLATIRQILRRVAPQDELNDEQSRSADRQRRRRSRRLGYAQQLIREMGGFSNFAISFSIISIPTGAVLLYGYGLKFAGPIINSVGWPVVSLFTLAVAASMAEIASAYPTAGSGEWMTKELAPWSLGRWAP